MKDNRLVNSFIAKYSRTAAQAMSYTVYAMCYVDSEEYYDENGESATEKQESSWVKNQYKTLASILGVKATAPKDSKMKGYGMVAFKDVPIKKLRSVLRNDDYNWPVSPKVPTSAFIWEWKLAINGVIMDLEDAKGYLEDNGVDF
jgi:hypothetical protein